MLYLYAASVRISRFRNSMFGSGPRDQSSESPRCAIAGQSRSVGTSSTASLPDAANELLHRLRAIEDARRAFPRSPSMTACRSRRNHVAFIAWLDRTQVLPSRCSCASIRSRRIDGRSCSFSDSNHARSCSDSSQVLRSKSVFRLPCSRDNPHTGRSNRNRLAPPYTPAPQAPGANPRRSARQLVCAIAPAPAHTKNNETREIWRRMRPSPQSKFAARLSHDSPHVYPEIAISASNDQDFA